MKRRASYAVILSISLVNPSQAQCAHQPPILATVTVVGCVAASFGATDSMFTFGPKYTIAGTDTWPMYKSGDKRSGTLLTVSVVTSKFVWTESSGHWTNGAHLWAKGESRSLFVESAPSDICPRVLPAGLAVRTEPECFDMFHNLLPVTIPLVTVIAVKAGR
jgi:hypothetical protein